MIVSAATKSENGAEPSLPDMKGILQSNMEASYEYLIHWLEEEPNLGPDWQTIVRPNSVASTHYLEDDDFGLILAEGRFSFSAEPPGLQVLFSSQDGSAPPPHDTVTGWVQEICDNIVQASGLPAEVRIEAVEI